MEILRKTTSAGNVGIVEMSERGELSATIGGESVGSGFTICPPRKIGGRTIVGGVGKLGLTVQEREIVETAISAYRQAKYVPATPAQIERNAIGRMFAGAERKKNYPGAYFPAIAEANAALAAWRVKYPADAEAERGADELAASERRAQRDANYANSFLAQGLD